MCNMVCNGMLQPNVEYKKTCFSRGFDKIESNDIGLKSFGSDAFLSFGSGITFAILNADGKVLVLMHRLYI